METAAAGEWKGAAPCAGTPEKAADMAHAMASKGSPLFACNIAEIIDFINIKRNKINAASVSPSKPPARKKRRTRPAVPPAKLPAPVPWWRVRWWRVGIAVTAAMVLGGMGLRTWWRLTIVPPAEIKGLTEDRPLVVIDAGHGGVDGGTQGFGVLEKHAALEVAKLTAQELRWRGARVRLTRSRDVTLPLAERPRLANDWGAAVFLSVHFNFSTQSSAIRGVEVYYSAPKTLEAQRAFAETLSRLGRLPSFSAPKAEVGESSSMEGPDAAVLEAADRSLAESVAAAVSERAKTPSRGTRNQPEFAVTRHAGAPAVLVECAYLSNPEDAARAKTTAWRQALAEGLAEGVWRWLNPPAP